MEDAQVAPYQWFPWDIVHAVTTSATSTTLPCKRHSEIIAAVQLSAVPRMTPLECDRSEDRRRSHVVGLALDPLLSRDDSKTCTVLPLANVIGKKGGTVPVALMYRASLSEPQKKLVEIFGSQFSGFASELGRRLPRVRQLGRELAPIHRYRWIHISTIRPEGRVWVTEPIRLWGTSGYFVKGFRWRRVPGLDRIEQREVFARVNVLSDPTDTPTESPLSTNINLVWRETIRKEYGLPEFINNQAQFVAQFTFKAESVRMGQSLVGLWQGSVRGTAQPFGSWVILSMDELSCDVDSLNAIVRAHLANPEESRLEQNLSELPRHRYPPDTCESPPAQEEGFVI